ncbi:MAG: hypothetical protein AB1390_01440 [Nitrospirota bacterium]
MNDYCITPPHVVLGVQPNLLLIIDNSASMYDPIYISANRSYCYDDTYDQAKDYAGYFGKIDPATQTISYPVYSYDFNEGKFIEAAFIPSSCTYGGSSTNSPFVCVNMAGTGSTRTITQFVASGKFLNWLAASKLDVQKQVLTGGKYDTTNRALVGESRGCVGRRFIRELPSLPGIVFAVRGPNVQEPDFINPDTQGGQARIEIYEGNYNEAACQDAVHAWLYDSLNEWLNASRNCFGISGGPGTASGRELATFIEAARACYQVKDNIAKGRTTPDDSGLFKNLSPYNLMAQCKSIYANDCPDPNNIVACSILNNKNRGNYICSASAIHISPAFPYYGSLGNDPAGFVGKCWNGSFEDERCVRREILHFCSGYSSSEVIDPSQGASENNTGNIPAIITDAGARSLGDPIKLSRGFCTRSTTTTCTQDSDCPGGLYDHCGRFFHAKVSTTPPKGLIQEFGGDRLLIRFGAMVFNCIGSSSEAVPGTCAASTNLDAGHILDHAYIGDPVGDHNSGMIKAINDINAISWTPLSEAFYNALGYFSQDTTKRINSTDFLVSPDKPNPVQHYCQTNNVLFITDGISTADQNSAVRFHISNTVRPAEIAASSNDDGQITTALSSSYTTVPEYYGSLNLDDLAWYAHNFSIFNPTHNNFSSDPEYKIQYAKDTIITHVIYMGNPCTHKDANGICERAGEASPEKLMQETAAHGGGIYQKVENPARLYQILKETFQSIAAKASSGTAASVLSSGEGSGANLIQALFFPQRTINGTRIEWTGSLQNFWFYIDPFLGSSIREDSASPRELNLGNDYIMHFRFPASATDENTVANLYLDSDCDGDGDSYIGAEYLDEFLSSDSSKQINYLWEAGKQLWAQSPDTRKIYTTAGRQTRIDFKIDSAETLMFYLQAPTVDNAKQIITYTRGADRFCSRSVSTSCTKDADCPSGETCLLQFRNRTVSIGGTANTWKLGDIINSTPKVASRIPLNAYHKVYKDKTYGPVNFNPGLSDPVDTKHFITTQDYKNRGMVFVGANDGMLHAFKLGTVRSYEDKCKKAELKGTNLGEEMWAYIPKHALPYLKFMADPDYCHLYYIDAVPNLFDISIGGNPDDPISAGRWRTVLIGGMRFGGACKDRASVYGVQTPAPDIGYSSYFALDITETLADPTKPPEVLWEFSKEDIKGLFGTGGLGFSTSGPAVVRIGPKGKNGRWFVVFASGPTGPIDTDAHQFMGYSDQELELYIIDLKGGPKNGHIWKIPSGLKNAFAGSLAGAPIDLDQNDPTKAGFYSDDVLYFGYTQAEAAPSTSKWTKGGVLRLMTLESANPLNWKLSKVIEDIGPVTAAVSKLQNYRAGQESLWLFFGTGRYYYKISSRIDDADNTRKIYGVRDPCFDRDSSNFDNKLDPNCSKTFSGDSSLGDVTGSSSNATADGWKITLDSCTTSNGSLASCSDSGVAYKAERLITDPLATPIGAVFFTTIKPVADVCKFGGISHLWAVDYDTGGAVKKGILRGKALLQVSTGNIEEIDLSGAFTQKQDIGAKQGETMDFRRTGPTEGLASSEKPQVSIPPKPMKKILHIRTR